MKTLSLRGMITAAAFLVAAGVASAQTYTAEVPIAFRAGGTPMASGSYMIQFSATEGHRTTLYNRTTQKSAIVLGAIPADPPKAWLVNGSPKVTFECLDGTCRLKSIWNGTGSYVQTFATPKPANLAAHRPELVTLTMIKVR